MIKKVKSAPLPPDDFRKLKQKTARFCSDFAAVCRYWEAPVGSADIHFAKGIFFVCLPFIFSPM